MTSPPRQEMPFLDHLEELRWRLIRAIGALVVSCSLAFWAVMRFDVLTMLQRPIAPYLGGRKLVYTHPGDAFSIVLTTSLILGTMLALPVILYQVWAFLSPALYKHEKRVVIPVLFGAALLFTAGVALAWGVVLPLTLSFLMTFQSASLEAMITAADYFGFATTMALVFGTVFELPVVIVMLTALGIVQPKMLAQYRRIAFVAIWLVSAFVTPGDFLGTTLVLAGALYLLYELSIALSHVVWRRRMKRQAAQAAEDAREALA